MKKIIIIIFLALVPMIAYADSSPEAMQFWGSPSDTKELNKIREFSPKNLDKGIVNILEGQWSIYPVGLKPPRYLGYEMDFDKNNRPTKYIGYQIDLNGDEKDEYLMIVPGGGSGGPMYIIISFIDDKWRPVGWVQGWMNSLLPLKNGWQPIVSFSKSGQEHLTIIFSEFTKGKYRVRWIERFDNGKITKEKIEQKSE